MERKGKGWEGRALKLAQQPLEAETEPTQTKPVVVEARPPPEIGVSKGIDGSEDEEEEEEEGRRGQT